MYLLPSDKFDLDRMDFCNERYCECMTYIEQCDPVPKEFKLTRAQRKQFRISTTTVDKKNLLATWVQHMLDIQDHVENGHRLLQEEFENNRILGLG